METNSLAEKSYHLILKALESKSTSRIKKHINVYKNHTPSKPNQNLVFDLVIEASLPNSAPVFYLIDCIKSIEKKVAQKQVEAFYKKLSQVKNVNAKGILVCDKSFEKQGMTFAKTKEILLVKLNKADNSSIVFYTSDSTDIMTETGFIENFSGLIRLSSLSKKINSIEQIRRKKVPSGLETEFVNVPQFWNFFNRNIN